MLTCVIGCERHATVRSSSVSTITCCAVCVPSLPSCQCFGCNVYTLMVMGTAGGDDRFHVLRLTGGFGANINIDKINKKVGANKHTRPQSVAAV